MKIILDTFSEVRDTLGNMIADGDFWNFDDVQIEPGALYVIGRMQMAACQHKIRQVIASGQAHVMFSNPAEGAATMLGQFDHLKIRDLVSSGEVTVLSGAPIPNNFKHMWYEHFLHRMLNFEENRASMAKIDQVFEKTQKPHKFLFLNGRLRTHRKWMLARLRSQGVLEQGLYTCLESRNASRGGITVMYNGVDLMNEIEPLHYLPAQYEINRYADRVGLPSQSSYAKFDLFTYQGQQEWGEAYVSAEPYIDSYFSIVTETIYDGIYSFRTEKIWKAIMMGHPWICVSNPGFYQDLRDLGFRTFDGIIDESFDTIHDTQARLERTATVIEDLCRSDLPAFLKACESVCKYNQQHMLQYHRKHMAAFPQRFLNFVQENIK